MIALSVYRAAVEANRAEYRAQLAYLRRPERVADMRRAVEAAARNVASCGALFEAAGIRQDAAWTPSREAAQGRILASVCRAGEVDWRRLHDDAAVHPAAAR